MKYANRLQEIIDAKEVEKNIIIAEFMQYKKEEVGLIGFKTPYSETLVRPPELKFNSSWDWLMPVIKKLDSLANEKFTIAEFDDYRTQWVMIDKPSKYPIENVYEQIAQFIEFLNKVK